LVNLDQHTRAVIIDSELVRGLVVRQFPEWADLPVTPVERDGVDNRTFRLGPELTVRLPAGDWYALQVEKEQRWLPVLRPQLPLPIPTPIAQGCPGEGYPYPWSVYRWLEGVPATGPIADRTAFAARLAAFLSALRRVDAAGGPGPGRHNFFRGGPLTTYAEETEQAIAALGGEVDGAACRSAWADAVAAPWLGDPVWFHGDVAVGNLLTRGGRLAAVIDFGSSGVGDPACDVVIAWTQFSGPSRAAFRTTLGVDASTWSRGRGWALWKALITLRGHLEGDPAAAAEPRRVIQHVLADHAGEPG
jgi:aminoglycoside phosphotransferase (APT) family kinase protein